MSKAISLLLLVWLSVFALGTWTQAEEYVKPPTVRAYGHVPTISKEQQKKCVILWHEAEQVEAASKQLDLYFDDTNQVHVDRWNMLVDKHNDLTDRYNRECAEKAAIKDEVVDELNQSYTAPVHIKADKVKRIVHTKESEMQSLFREYGKDEIMHEVVKELNKDPFSSNGYVTQKSIDYTSATDRLSFYYDVNETSTNRAAIDMLAMERTEYTMNAACSDPSMREFLSEGIEMYYNYRTERGIFLFDIVIQEADCRRLTSPMPVKTTNPRLRS